MLGADARAGDDPAPAPVRPRRARAEHCPRSRSTWATTGRSPAPIWPSHDESHQVIEEFMLAANEAVAAHLTEHARSASCGGRTPTPSRSSSTSSPSSPAASGWSIEQPQSRFELQRVLERDDRQARGVRRPLRPAAQPEAGDLHARARGPLRPGQRRTTATSPRRSAAIPTSRSIAS